MLHTTIRPTLLDSGNWDDATRWERHVTPDAPPDELCSAAFCVAIKDDKIVLMRAARGWGMLGGHIEENETIIDALHREAHEEGGFLIDQYVLCGYRKIIATRPSPHPTPGRAYPFPVSYIPFYLVTTDRPLIAATGDEALETSAFTIEQIEAMGISDWAVVNAVWNLYADR